jgi:hypothetical protein
MATRLGCEVRVSPVTLPIVVCALRHYADDIAAASAFGTAEYQVREWDARGGLIRELAICRDPVAAHGAFEAAAFEPPRLPHHGPECSRDPCARAWAEPQDGASPNSRQVTMPRSATTTASMPASGARSRNWDSAAGLLCEPTWDQVELVPKKGALGFDGVLVVPDLHDKAGIPDRGRQASDLVRALASARRQFADPIRTPAVYGTTGASADQEITERPRSEPFGFG